MCKCGMRAGCLLLSPSLAQGGSRSSSNSSRHSSNESLVYAQHRAAGTERDVWCMKEAQPVHQQLQLHHCGITPGTSGDLDIAQLGHKR